MVYIISDPRNNYSNLHYMDFQLRTRVQSKVPLGVAVAEKVLQEGWEAFDENKMAYYEVAELDGRLGAQFGLDMIANFSPDQKYGYVLFHKFLQQVGVGNSFLCTNPTEAGEAFFEKFDQEGIITPVYEYGAITPDDNPQVMSYSCKYKVIADPMEHLKHWVEAEKKRSIQPASTELYK